MDRILPHGHDAYQGDAINLLRIDTRDAETFSAAQRSSTISSSRWSGQDGRHLAA
ncbi:MAG: hypothetical protein WAN71_20045 [Mycobacterium sp.]|uniref:hypothetical protein n=1 Tax=Mycobacterium sp. TaxID=1785 RepID=UPI003BB19401